jgi:hypothetical protein
LQYDIASGYWFGIRMFIRVSIPVEEVSTVEIKPLGAGCWKDSSTVRIASYSGCSRHSKHSLGNLKEKMMTMFKQMMAGVRAAQAARALRASNGPAGRFGRVGRMAQRGLSMLEISLVLIVIAIILVAVYIGFQQNQRRAEINENVANITQVISTAQARFGKTGGYAGLSTAIAVQTRLIPDNLRIAGGNTAQNSYGGLLAVAPVTCVTANDCLTLTWTRTPSSQCAEIVMAVVNSVRRVNVGAVDIKPLDGALVVATLAAQCDLTANVDLVFTIGRGA